MRTITFVLFITVFLVGFPSVYAGNEIEYDCTAVDGLVEIHADTRIHDFPNFESEYEYVKGIVTPFAFEYTSENLFILVADNRGYSGWVFVGNLAPYNPEYVSWDERKQIMFPAYCSHIGLLNWPGIDIQELNINQD